MSEASSTLPIGEVLSDVVQKLEAGSSLVLSAPPGAGKTTVVPLALLARASWLAQGGRVIMLEPRRLAAKAAARRMSAALGERAGGTVGYSVRGDSAVGSRTRIEVVTPGILVRRLQNDPALTGVAAVILDEFHERGVDGDLILTLAAQAQQLLRPELRLLIMSATLEGSLAEDCSRLLGGAPVLRSQGRCFPVRLVHLQEPKPERGELEEAVAAAVRQALAESPGDALVFLPGAPEIRRVQRLLDERLGRSVKAVPLYGDLPQEAQDEALAPPPAGERRVVLSTSIAESSLTIPGVKIVVDAGLSRSSAFSPGTGFSRLVTVKTSTSSADQRAGRAGRTAPGVCYRLYSEYAGSLREAQARPEILSADLTPLALELALWGAGPDCSDLQWLDAPPAAGMAVARALLQRLGALDAITGLPTAHGRRMSALGAHPRVAHMVIRASESGPHAARLACLVAALLEERDVLRRGPTATNRGPGSDLRLRVDAVMGRARNGAAEFSGWLVDAAVSSRVRESAALLQTQLKSLEAGSPPDAGPVDFDADAPSAVGLLLALAYPDRVARRNAGTLGTYNLSSGRQAAFKYPQEEPLVSGSDFIVAADLDGETVSARIYSAAPLPSNAPDHPWISPLRAVEERVFWNPSAGSVGARRLRLLGSIVLSEDVLPAPKGDAAVNAVLDGVREHVGINGLPWSRPTQEWRYRVLFLRSYAAPAVAAAGVPPLPDLSDASLLATLDVWLSPFLVGAVTKALLANVNVDAALRLLLTPAQLRFVEASAPSHFDVPSGSRLPIDYQEADRNGGVPVLEVRLQELFGFAASPTIAGVPLCLSLLSPAGRPVARTSDLCSFWDSPSGYAAVRKDLRGRYPKHPWPEDPRSATPTSRRKPKGQ